MTSNMTSKKNILVGAHVSIAGEMYKSVERALSIGATTMQIFTKSSRSWVAKKLTDQNCEDFKTAVKSSGLSHLVAHASYLINIGTHDGETERKAVDALTDELMRCEQLGIPYLVLHPGSHVGEGIEKGIKQIAKHLDAILQKIDGKTIIALETMAGQGTNLGSTFEEIKTIIDLCEEKKRIGVCLDTCHIFSAGYDISTTDGYKKVMKSFDEIIGLKKLKVVHINDSKTAFNSHKDRHEELGKGSIPLETFKLIMHDKNLENIPKILETPTDDEMKLYCKEIKLLKELSA